MDIVLVPGLWLDGSSWSRVLPLLQAAGHRTHPVTLPGMQAKDADRSQVTLSDCVTAVTAAIDSCDDSVLLVGHSLGSAIATAALDARTEKVAGVIMVGGFPAASGGPIADGFAVEGDGIPLPALTEFDDADLRDMDQAITADFVARAIPSPARLTTDPLELTDDGRYWTPLTAVCTEYDAATLRGWIADDAAPVAEFPRYAEVGYVDLPTGHWPQFTKPDELAAIILGAIPVSVGDFLRADGLADWRSVGDRFDSHFPLPSLTTGAELARQIAQLAPGGTRVDVDLRVEGITVSIPSWGYARDVDLARQISTAAYDLGLSADPSKVQYVGLRIGAHVPADVLPFWQAVLGYRAKGEEDVVDPLRRLPDVQFMPTSDDLGDQMQFHLDVVVPHEQAEARVQAALAAGGRLVTDEFAPRWWTLADAEGNVVDIARAVLD
ncbi:alpha/beta fold hydrolase [Microlunatus soli]|uniref:Pimeloyl-ACP methyl ester carboxylesterase n=1 Tax=Microlunatus soli TaxID=630515 RepID=A0A1H1ZXR8_9ACTN|nr:alpha/beta fold hydrolase [Microlunatus soli]SDT38036.1 Pimeloyl-ACP methyl ester carboxylesterase [Microlunatus soli]